MKELIIRDERIIKIIMALNISHDEDYIYSLKKEMQPVSINI